MNLAAVPASVEIQLQNEQFANSFSVPKGSQQTNGAESWPMINTLEEMRALHSEYMRRTRLDKFIAAANTAPTSSRIPARSPSADGHWLSSAASVVPGCWLRLAPTELGQPGSARSFVPAPRHS